MRRLRALTRDPSTLVVGVTGGVGTKALRSRYAAPNVLVEDYLEFDSLLPQADVFVGNGGHGSVLQALRHGVPLVVAGRREGKNDINSRLAWNGLGIDLRTEKPSARSIRRAVDRATADETLHLRVARVADRLRSLDGLDLATRGITGTAQETPARRPAVGA